MQRTHMHILEVGVILSLIVGPSAHARILQDRPAQDGLYTTAQAERGKALYETHCTACHGSSLRGGANEFAAPPLAGPFFFEKWQGRTLDELFRYSVENMPPGQDHLLERTYLDVTAYILQVLKYPAGRAELTADAPGMKRPIERQP